MITIESDGGLGFSVKISYGNGVRGFRLKHLSQFDLHEVIDHFTRSSPFVEKWTGQHHKNSRPKCPLCLRQKAKEEQDKAAKEKVKLKKSGSGSKRLSPKSSN